MAVNRNNFVIASLPRPGYLNAHLNLSDRPKENERQRAISSGVETGETDTIHLKSPSVDLKSAMDSRVARQNMTNRWFDTMTNSNGYSK